MGVREGVSRMTLSVYRLHPNGEREDIKPAADYELGDASRWLPCGAVVSRRDVPASAESEQCRPG
ncbi:hypothetical protein [Embleya sp. MST-111070]|uniref:hypothetical protein n=1 Tax=Embleya sp. MST-111070 TaxID=3398231 RepID=UPI003F734F22